MLITNLNIGRNGRLGNQLFQAASVIGVAERTLAIYGFAGAWKTPWDCFDRPLNLLSQDAIKQIQTQTLERPLVNLSEGKMGYKNIPQLIIHNFPEEPFINGDRLFNLDGYFQSEKYFAHCRPFVLDIFKPNPKILEYIDNNYPFVKDDEWTSLHVRRGDYVELSKAHPLNPHPVQPIEYYQKALEELDARKVLVFSDDIGWCKENFKGDKFKFVEERTHSVEEKDQSHPNFNSRSDSHLVSDYTEINLMAACTNHIIANSSFSWWGAWLNQDPDKKVIAPLNWFSPEYAAEAAENPLSYINDLIPDSWKII